MRISDWSSDVCSSDLLAQEYGINAELRVVWSDGPDHDAALRALHCDLVVAAGSGPEHSPTLWSPERLWLAKGIPLLLIPTAWNEAYIGNKVVISWNRSRQARRRIGRGSGRGRGWA